MRFEVLTVEYDPRLSNYMVSARADYEWYLSKTAGSELNLEIQRDIIKGSKPYKNLRDDIRAGCVLPTIVLAIQGLGARVLDNYRDDKLYIDARKNHLEALTTEIGAAEPAQVEIIDGLQRTNALRQVLADLRDDVRADFLSRSIRLEIWVNIPFFPLAYRMLLLNAGQRPMSMKHQIDILSGGLASDLSDIQGLEIHKVKDHKRRVKPGQFHLSTIAQAFQAWIQRTPNVDKTNLVVETMVVDEALETLGIDLSHHDDGNHRDSFREFMSWIVSLDQRVGDNFIRFFGNDTVVLGFAAAVGFAHKNEILGKRLESSMSSMLKEAENQDNPLGILTFENLRKGIDVKKSNIGEATRNLVFQAVREHITQSGTAPLDVCWTQAANMSV